MTLFKIKNRFTGAVQFECELTTEVSLQSFSLQMGFAIKAAVMSGADLSFADLSCADLNGANLEGVDLRGANLGDADLSYANLRNANLFGATMIYADLRYANLEGASLYDTNLRFANLRRAHVEGASLNSASLEGVDLSTFKQDLIAEILRVPNEIEGLRRALVEGRIDGSTYSAECACLAGTVANLRGFNDYRGEEIFTNGIRFSVDCESPREIWFLGIKPGDTPETNPMAQIALEWIDEAIAIRDNIIALGKTEK